MPRLDDDKRRKEARQDEVPSTSGLDERQQNNQHNQPHMDFAKSLATKILLEVEKSRGDVNQQPAGMLNVVDSTVNAFQPKQFISVFRPTDGVFDDDEFFHVTCHVDRSLIKKIKRGEFVELKRLLMKDKFRKKGDDNR